MFLCLLLCLANFSVVANAAEDENLIDSDLRNWEVLTGDCEISQSSGNPDYYYISLGYSSQVALVYDLADLNLSDSYLLSFFLMNDNTARSFFKNYTVTVGVIVLDSSGEYIVDSNQAFYEIDSSNYLNFVTNPFELSFKMNTFVGKPAICFVFTPTSDFIEDSYPDLFYVKNISLVSSSSETNSRLDGILGWLQELWDSITDGFSNLGLSITHLGDRLQTKLGEVITNLSGEVQSVKEGITTKLGEVSINISAAFSSVGDRIQNKLGEVITGLTGELRMLGDNIKNSIRDFFIPPEGFFDTWKAKFNLMLENNLGFVYQAPNFVIEIIEVIQEILESDQEVNLVFPEVEFDIAGYHIELFKDTKVDFSFLESGIWLTLYSMYKVMLYVIFALALIKYGMSTWERTMSN